MTDNSRYHIPVMAKETIKNLALKPNSLVVDATLGGGGHAKQILSSEKNIELIGIDQDDQAIEAAKEELKLFGDRIRFVQDNFLHLKKAVGEKKVNGILFDLGVSSHQIDSKDRGFSFQHDAPLDMRMNKKGDNSAEDIINTVSQAELEQIIRDFGEERYYKRIAAAIIRKRPLTSTAELAEVVKFSIPKTVPANTIKSIARVFQAFRIAVNGELAVLEGALNDAIELLSPGGRIIVISYHSLEDRIVKETFKKEATDCICPPKLPKCMCTHKKKLNIITKKPLVPSEEEIKENPRARSAKMRVAERI